MKDTKLSTDSYKGVRDFLPEDMAIQRYIFDTWSATAEKFGYIRYDASVLEPAELYKSKGAANEEIINEQTYTFIDRGEREVTLRPEMTPTVARLIARERRELAFPVRWYSIPNLFRYERPQRGRLREHWQLNCDMFGCDDYTADVEVIALAYQLLIDFGATPDTFQVRVNDRVLMRQLYESVGITDPVTITAITRLNDRIRKISDDEYKTSLSAILNDNDLVDAVINIMNRSYEDTAVIRGLKVLGINNVVFDPALARGFDYYTGTIFEVFDISGENNRSLIGGGRYDNLTSMFSDEPISGIGFGMGDVTMRDFLTTHGLLNTKVPVTAPTLMIIPTDTEQNLEAERIAQLFRARDVKTAVDISTKKIGKKIADAAKQHVQYVLVVGSEEIMSHTFTIKDLSLETSTTGSIDELLANLILRG